MQRRLTNSLADCVEKMSTASCISPLPFVPIRPHVQNRPVHPSIQPSIHHFIDLFVHPFIHQSIHPSIHFIDLFVHPFIHQSIHPSIYGFLLFIHPFVQQSILPPMPLPQRASDVNLVAVVVAAPAPAAPLHFRAPLKKSENHSRNFESELSLKQRSPGCVGVPTARFSCRTFLLVVSAVQTASISYRYHMFLMAVSASRPPI